MIEFAEGFIILLAAAATAIDVVSVAVSVKRRRFEGKNDRLFNSGSLPLVSVLVAARNEEAAISRCLKSLAGQDYPADLLEILVGDDGSTDTTADIVHGCSRLHKNIRLYRIGTEIGSARAKANVLAQLAAKAKGDVLLITDADMYLPSGWCRAMVAAFRRGDGIVTGFTGVEPSSAFARLQALEWAAALGKVKALTDLGQPVTSMGNNMAVLTEAYRATGGYEAMPFSITEDHQLAWEISRRGYRIRQLADVQVTGITLPEPTIAAVLRQRARWVKGVMGLPVWLILLLGLQAAYYPAAVAGIFMIRGFWLLALVKLLVQAVFCVVMTKKSRQPLKIADSLAYEFYSAIISLSTVFYYAFSGRTVWKERSYF